MSLSEQSSANDFVDQEALGLSMEHYAYLVSSNTFTPYGVAAARTLPLDSFITTMDAFESCSTFGAFFAGCHELYKMIPSISLLASRRLEEEVAGALEPSQTLRFEHDQIQAHLVSWTLPATLNKAIEIADDHTLRQHAGEALRHALHIYLITALAGATVTTAIREIVAEHVKAVFAAIPNLVASRRYIAAILWPSLVAGSCIVKPAWQEVMLHELCKGWFQFRQLEVWGKLLRLLYDDPDPRAYGPYGLHLIMEKHGLNVANA